MQRAAMMRSARRVGAASAHRPFTAKAPAVCRPSRWVAKAAVTAEADAKEKGAAVEASGPEVDPTTQQIGGLLTALVLETDIAELHVQMGSFELKVRRSVQPTAAAIAAAAPPPAAVAPVVIEARPMLPEAAGMEESIDESLVSVASPKVGIFRRGRYAGGKRVGKGNTVNVGDQVKKGQSLGFVEQLGTHFPVEAPQAGEVARFVVQDGAAVEYLQQVVEIAPFFGGHIIGDKKYA